MNTPIKGTVGTWTQSVEGRGLVEKTVGESEGCFLFTSWLVGAFDFLPFVLHSRQDHPPGRPVIFL